MDTNARPLEMVLGLVFSLGVVAMFAYTLATLTRGSIAGTPAYAVTATFANVGGLKRGAAVTLAGVKIGEVRDIAIDDATFAARSVLEISTAHDYIPRDSSAQIRSNGLLGEQYIALAPGDARESLRHGDRIGDTHAAIVLEQVIGQLLAGRPREVTAQ